MNHQINIDSEPLKNNRHEAFAQKIALGHSAAEAYALIYGTEKPGVASAAGCRLLHKPEVDARVQSIRRAGAEGVALDLREMHAFLTRVARTPAGSVTPSSDLCMRVKVSQDGTETAMPDKLGCVQFSARLQGFFQKPAAAPPPQPSNQNPDTPRIITEERLAVIRAAKRVAALEQIRQAEETRLAEGQNHPPAHLGIPAATVINGRCSPE